MFAKFKITDFNRTICISSLSSRIHHHRRHTSPSQSKPQIHDVAVPMVVRSPFLRLHHPILRSSLVLVLVVVSPRVDAIFRFRTLRGQIHFSSFYNEFTDTLMEMSLLMVSLVVGSKVLFQNLVVVVQFFIFLI